MLPGSSSSVLSAGLPGLSAHSMLAMSHTGVHTMVSPGSHVPTYLPRLHLYDTRTLKPHTAIHTPVRPTPSLPCFSV